MRRFRAEQAVDASTSDAGEPAHAVDRVDDATRPRLPAGDDAGQGRNHEQAHLLVAVHDQLRAEMAQVLELVTRIEAGAADPVAGRSLIARMTMRQNYWTMGSFCATYCRVVTMHHTIEDQRMFPHLLAEDAALAPVVARLSEEHEVIAGLLDGLDRVLVEMVGSAAVSPRLRARAEQLSEDLLSHLAYEEQQLLGPLSRSTVVL